MGKNKTAVKQATPISLPHDGPIHQACQSAVERKDASDAVKRAVYLLSNDNDNEIGKDETVAALEKLSLTGTAGQSRNFLCSLKDAKQIQEQLHVVHTYKSWRLQNAELPTDPVLYRILVEWMLSSQTPVTLRRALQSTLGSMLADGDKESKGFASIHSDVLETILRSLVAQDAVWGSPIHSLQELLNWERFQQTLEHDSRLMANILQALERKSLALIPLLEKDNGGSSLDEAAIWNGDYVKSIQHCLAFSQLIKTVLGPNASVKPTKALGRFLWAVLACKAVPADKFSMVAISYGRTVAAATSDTGTALTSVLAEASNLPDIPRAALLQGLAATMPWDELASSSGEAGLPLLTFLTLFEKLALESIDPEVRLTALKGIRSLVSRCQSSGDSIKVDKAILTEMADRILQISLQSWENPPTRRLASGIPSLFRQLVHWMQQLQMGDTSFFSSLVKLLLEQPLHRKGRYLGLDTILPLAGAQLLLDGNLLEDLMDGMCDHGHNTGVMADLWANILQQYLAEMATEDNPDKLPQAWLDVWAGPLAQALVGKTKTSRRKQLSAFCLPRLISIASSRARSAQAFTSILQKLDELSRETTVVASASEETRDARILWAQLEVAGKAAELVLPSKSELKCSSPTLHYIEELRAQLASSVSRSRLIGALRHRLPTIRVVALQSVRSIVQCYIGISKPLETVQEELSLFRLTIPFAVKTDGKEYAAVLLESLFSCIDRLMSTEAGTVSPSQGGPLVLPETLSFIADFLLGKMVRFLGYPGSAASKETFFLALIERVALFSSREFKMNLGSEMISKNNTIWLRRRKPVEEETMRLVRQALLAPEVFAVLFTTLHSIWDSTRASAYRLVLSLLSLAQDASLEIPHDFRSPGSRALLLNQATSLASSPRQREADSGACLLAILCHSLLDNQEQKIEFISRLVDEFELRLLSMREQLTAIVNDSIDLTAGNLLPLAHGYIQALRMIVEYDPIFAGEIEDPLSSLLDRMTQLYNRAIQISLSIVADVREGEMLEGLEPNEVLDAKLKSSETKVNPGAIGANGIFSSVSRVSEEEQLKRLASQRIVMGSWLMTRETCAAVAVVLSLRKFHASSGLVDRTGMLLISTLTSLKHTGAAFAAHRALQRMAQRCLADSKESALPQLLSQWAGRLLDEVSEVNRIRDSTLRRSAGYGLGFLSIMRAEIASRPKPRSLCSNILQAIIQRSLPSQSKMKAFIENVGINEACIFSTLGSDVISNSTPDSQYEPRSRIHALNVLRLVILDAPLSSEVLPIIGDAISSAVIGYTDREWAVRNSATMVFAAIMLRSIDADKNASNVDKTSRNAINATELFRSYPLLPGFLLAILSSSLEGVLSRTMAMSLPPVLPILLLLSRIQPVAQSGSDAVSWVEPFVPWVFRALEHKEICIRKAAARVLCNISSREEQSSTFYGKIATSLIRELDAAAILIHGEGQVSWNRLHGNLVAVEVLARSSCEAKVTLQIGLLDHSFFQFAWFQQKKPALPPSCIMALTDILAELYGDEEFVFERYREVLFWVEENYSEGSCLPGVGELAIRIARISTTELCRRLWNDENSLENAQSVLEQVARIVQCSILDVRLSAVKAFKKALYDGLDVTVGRAEEDSHASCELISSVATVLVKALVKEFGLGEPHQPTLRRLSRCLIECYEAAERIGSVKDCTQQGKALLADALTPLLAGNYSGNCDAQTPLLGNAAELKSFSMSRENEAQEHAVFQTLLEYLGNPRCHWRVRYSAAAALQRSGLDSISLRASFLQDVDEDVRTIASRAIDSVSEMALSETFHGDPVTMLLFALDAALEMSKGLLARIRSVGITESDDGSRKIFEEEDPNSYSEQILPFQYALTAVMKNDDAVEQKAAHSQICMAKFRVVQDLSDSILTALDAHFSALVDSSNVCVLDMTRHPQIFGPLHSLILTASLAVVLIPAESVAVVTAPRTILTKSLIAMMDKGSCHPCIRDALNMLHHAKFRREETKEAIIENCFLSRLIEC